MDERGLVDIIQRYRRDGFVSVPQVLTPDEVDEYVTAARNVLHTAEITREGAATATVLELVRDCHLLNRTMLRLALHPRITHIAEHLAGQPLRLFKQELVRKERDSCLPTGAHTDVSAYPFDGAPVSSNVWVALVDVPLERGCLSFVAGSHLLPNSKAREYTVGEDPAIRWPGSQWLPIVTVPLRAGDCTFHDARTIHMAETNDTDEPRISAIATYMDHRATYSPTGNPYLDNLVQADGLAPGRPLDGPRFPLLDGSDLPTE